MMKMYPEHLPQSVREDSRRSAECKVYDALSKLSDGYTVFYSIGWQIRESQKGTKDGETDFVIAHPEKGLMILEIKGGQIRYDATQKKWFSLARSGIEYDIKDPVDQARNSKGALLEKLRELRGWTQSFLTIGYLVVFPDSVADQAYFRPDLPRELIVDTNDLDFIETRIEQGFAWYYGNERKQGILGKERLRLLENFLASSFTLRTTLGVILQEEESQIIQLTENQLHVLNFIQKQRRALIEGCAGSGKTMLALEKARRLAEQGFDTLLLCFNAPLADFLRQRAHKDVEVNYFHGLCKSLAKEAGIGFRAYTTEDEYYNSVLPDMLLEAVLELGAQYDAIVVDEGQDFHEAWWDTLFHLLRDPENGIFYIFFDSNQNIYHRQGTLEKLIQIAPFPLTENCRNTVAIHQVVKGFHQEPDMLTCRGPAGRSPTISYFSSSSEQEEQVQKAIQHLVEAEKISPERVVLLTTRAPESAGFPPNKKIGNLTLAEWSDGTRGNSEIRVSSVHRFKGLESRIVILTGLEDNDPDWINPLLYVACSRARTHLIVIAHERSRLQLKAIFHHK